MAVSIVAIGWFVVAFPAQWSTQTGHPTIIGLYAVGLGVMAVGGVLIPTLTDRVDLEAEVSALQAELNTFRKTLKESEADEAEQAAVIADLRRTLADSEAERTTDEAAVETAHARTVEELRADLADSEADIADTEADEADLGAQLRLLRSSQAQFELYEDRGGAWRWRLRHQDGTVLAASNGGYKDSHDAQNELERVRRNALGATLLLVESEEDLPEEGSVDGFVFPDDAEGQSQADFELYEDEGGEYRWRLRHENGNIIAGCGEGYATRSGAEHAIDRIRGYVGPADYLRPDPTAIELYRDMAGEWRWRLVHRNGNILAGSGDGYASRSGARRAIDRLRDGIGDMEIEVYEDDDGGFRWRLAGGDDRIKADSGRYESRDGAEDAVERVRTFLPDADLIDIGQATFEVYEDEGGEYRWRLRHRNGNVLADAREGYSNRSGALRGIESVKRNAPNAGREA